uniref:Diacylglycerol kinase n=1 Tax=Curvibacter symbiont subsp. Hydra magnipapillata TaxID=667019 RepID=C9YAD1_CURXX|nr:Diacylglycerol kinase [Curvibacter putative symbiont of Hydra magnipapillata]
MALVSSPLPPSAAERRPKGLMESTPENHIDPAVNPQKQRRGLSRILHATRYSWAGLQAGWNEPAFRQECVLALVLLPASLYVGQSWLESAVLAASVIAVMVVELLNTAVESVVDRVGPEWHQLSKRAKDIGSAAVLLSLLLCAVIWCAALWQRFAV